MAAAVFPQGTIELNVEVILAKELKTKVNNPNRSEKNLRTLSSRKAGTPVGHIIRWDSLTRLSIDPGA